MIRTFGTALLAVAVVTAVAPAAAQAQATTARVFANCTAMHKVYPHGVGKWGARDHTSGKPVTTFKRSNAIYAANKKSDRDKDGIACELK